MMNFAFSLTAMEEIKTADQHDWFDDLTEDQQSSVLRGLEQADKGETISHDEAVKLLDL